MVYEFGVYGDSIAFGYGNHNISWFDILSVQRNSFKLAQNGAKIADVLHKIKFDTSQYEILFFAVGINDLLQSSPSSEDFSCQDLLANYEEILQIAKTKSSRVIVQSVLPVREALFPNQDWLDHKMWAQNKLIVCFNAELAKLCQKLAIDFYDFYTLFLERDLNNLYLDAVHLNNDGQVLLSEFYYQATNC